MSSERPQRPSGVFCATERRKSGSACSPKLVSIQPGHSTLTRTSGARLSARLLLNASTPPLTAENSCGFSPAMPLVTWSQLMLTIAPPRSWSRMMSPMAYEHAIVPFRSTASRTSSLCSHSHSAASPVSTSAPALLTHTSTRPSSSCAPATRRSHPSRVARSAWRTSARPPRDTIASATSRARSGEPRCVSSTTAPSAAYVSAMARPMPLLAPVTTACRPANRPSRAGSVDGSAVAALALHARRERMPRRLGRTEDVAHAGLVGEGARDRLLRGLVVVVEDLLVVSRFPVDEDAADDAEVVDVALADHALADRVDDGTSHGRLGGPEHLHRLGGALDRHLVRKDRVRLSGEVGRDHREQVRVPLLLVDEGVRERLADRPALGADQEVDVRDLVALADERLSNQQRRGHETAPPYGCRCA